MDSNHIGSAGPTCNSCGERTRVHQDTACAGMDTSLVRQQDPSVNAGASPVARKADFNGQRDQAVGVQFVLRPPEWFTQQLLFSPSFTAA